MEPSKDHDMKWVDEAAFAGFPKRLPEDCVEYSIYIIDKKLRAHEALRQTLLHIQKAASSLTKHLLKDYIWQRDEFKLELVHPHKLSQEANGKTHKKNTKDESPTVPYLHGLTNFGDSIADEWLVVYLLRELSKKYPSAWIRLDDTDGEFLLIEAANTLPKWLEPETANYRVWINKGQLRIIPLTRSAEPGAMGPPTPGLPADITLADALHFITTTPQSLIHSPLIEAEAFHRLEKYPSEIQLSQHNARLPLPRKLAFILHANPSYVAPAIEAFYLRDPIAVKPLATNDTATLLFPPEDFVSVSVRVPKVGYAQLHSQQFDPPPSWTCVRPHISEKAVAMGMKLSCGFEMLVRDPQNGDKRAVREIQLLLEDLESGEEALPTDVEMRAWEQRVDDDAWLDVDFEEFSRELDGKGVATGAADSTAKAGKPAAGAPQEEANDLHNLVSRFERFINDDKAGFEGAEMDSDSDSDSDSGSDTSDASSSDPEEDKAASFDDAEFEQAMRDMMGMPREQQEANGLVDEARKLALEMESDDEGEEDEQADGEEKKKRDEADEVQEIMRLMELELKTRGALDLDGKHAAGSSDRERVKASVAEQINAQAKGNGKVRTKGKGKNKGKGKGKAAQVADESDAEVYELSSDDEDPLGGMDANLLKNLLEAFKGQVGTAGPAGNLMKQLGVKMPRDEED